MPNPEINHPVVYLIVFLAILGLGIVAAVARRGFFLSSPGAVSPPPLNPADMECCGQHEVCEKDSLLAALSREVEYYDDEELDRFRGRRETEYSEAEEEEFRDILYTMRSDEVAGWVRSLQLREVALPEGLKDEMLLIVGERRQ